MALTTFDRQSRRARVSIGVVLAIGCVVALLAGFSALQASTPEPMPYAQLPTPTPTGCWASPTPQPPYSNTPAAIGTVEPRVAHCMDDAYARTDTGEVLVGTAFVRTGARLNGAVTYMTGFLFRDVRIPRDAADSRCTAAPGSLGLPERCAGFGSTSVASCSRKQATSALATSPCTGGRGRRRSWHGISPPSSPKP